DEPWRTEWLTFGLSDDGWTLPNRTARVRLFSPPDQKRSVIRTLTLGVQAPTAIRRRPFRVVSNRAEVRSVANDRDRVLAVVEVCVPAHGYADVRVTASGHSPTY